jgi:hypothetical protein
MMFWKPKHKEPSMKEISTRIRGFLLDTQTQNAYAYSLIMGCSPLSVELREHEEDESEKRIEKIAYLNQFLFAYAKTLSEATVEFHRKAAPEVEVIPDAAWKYTRKLLDQVTLSVLVGAISQLVDMGLLQIPRNKQ